MKERNVYKHEEKHYVSRTSWLRAAVLGANDGIISVSSLVIGVAVAAVGSKEILIAGVAGLVSGAMSMAAGEYVVSGISILLLGMLGAIAARIGGGTNPVANSKNNVLGCCRYGVHCFDR
jgi:VIT1/CCC1 family predicted Fe2+/Mn2+ transporter